MGKFVVVSYYTKDTFYEKVAQEHIIDSLKEFPEIESNIVEVPNLGTWDKNTHYKATFIKQQLVNFKKPVVFLDCDARINKYPQLFDEIDCDIAFHTWKIRQDREDLLSGTLYVNYNEKMLEFMSEWITELTVSGNTWEQIILAHKVKKWADRLNIVHLPGEYCKIFDRMDHIKNRDAVIEHFQKSRLARAANSLAKDAKPVIRR